MATNVQPRRSKAMQALHDELETLRNADCTVLILGETGTGKSVLARRIHEFGARPHGPFVDVNCAGLTSDFVESVLFGHERGSFTGAYATKSGLLEAAHGGTLFLDEIGDMDIRVQPKLLKVLEEKRFRRMGDARERRVDVRLVAATHHDLLDAIERRTFRQDLYYRVSTVTLTMPPLRDRREDILAIAAEMLAQIGGGVPIELSRSAAVRLVEHSWPGNLRELKNVLERALLRRRNHVVHADDLRFDPPRSAPRLPAASTPARLLADEAGAATRNDIEREHIRLALAAENGQIKAAARRLGMSRSTLYTKLKVYRIERPQASGVRVGGSRAAPG